MNVRVTDTHTDMAWHKRCQRFPLQRAESTTIGEAFHLPWLLIMPDRVSGLTLSSAEFKRQLATVLINAALNGNGSLVDGNGDSDRG